jgi:hypothetical protein
MNSKDIYNIDKFGRLLGTRLHDGILEEFEFSNNKHLVHLRIKRVSGESVSIRLLGVSMLTVTEFWGAAILSHMNVWDILPIQDKYFDAPDRVWNILFSNRASKEEMPLFVRQIAAKFPTALVVQIECSYGAAIAAICQYIEIDGNLLDTKTMFNPVEP